VLSIFAQILVSDTTYLVASRSLRKSRREVRIGVSIDVSYVGNELSMTTDVSKLVSLKRVLAKSKFFSLKLNSLSPWHVSNTATNSVSWQRNFRNFLRSTLLRNWSWTLLIYFMLCFKVQNNY
jgi:hypothetical protein